MPQSAIEAWKHNNSGYWYSEGISWAVGWREIDECWFYFDSDGDMKTSLWIETNGKWTKLHLKSPYDGLNVMPDFINMVDIDNINIQNVDLSKFEGFDTNESGKYRIGYKKDRESDPVYAEFEVISHPGLV